jgi:hypothetical protein
MRDYGTVVERVERVVYHVPSGSLLPSWMEAIIYQRPKPVLVLTRSTLMPNASAAIGIYTVISGATLEEWKQNMAEQDLMLWKPLPDPKSGLETNWWN